MSEVIKCRKDVAEPSTPTQSEIFQRISLRWKKDRETFPWMENIVHVVHSVRPSSCSKSNLIGVEKAAYQRNMMDATEEFNVLYRETWINIENIFLASNLWYHGRKNTVNTCRRVEYAQTMKHLPFPDITAVSHSQPISSTRDTFIVLEIVSAKYNIYIYTASSSTNTP